MVDRNRFRRRRDIERFLRFVESIDPRIVINFLPQLATGRGAQADSFRHPAECDGVARRIVASARSLGRPVNLLFGTVDTFIGCPGAGGKLMNVDITGNVTVCISKASLGNLLEEPFEQIYARFVDGCRKLKVGFFCCRVNEATGQRVLEPEESDRALQRFYESSTDSTWQQFLDKYGWLLARIMGSPAG